VDNYHWGEEQFEALHHFSEHLSGHWHPTEWGVIIRFLSKIKDWDGGLANSQSEKDMPTRDQLYVSQYMQLFITTIAEAGYFEDLEDFYLFLRNATGDDTYAIFRTWVRLGMPLEEGYDNYQEFLDEYEEFLDMREQESEDMEVGSGLINEIEDFLFKSKLGEEE